MKFFCSCVLFPRDAFLHRKAHDQFRIIFANKFQKSPSCKPGFKPTTLCLKDGRSKYIPRLFKHGDDISYDKRVTILRIDFIGYNEDSPKNNTPSDFKEIIGNDKRKAMVQFANENYKDEKEYFVLMDTERD